MNTELMKAVKRLDRWAVTDFDGECDRAADWQVAEQALRDLEAENARLHAEIAAAVRDSRRMDWAEHYVHVLDWDPHEPMKRVIRGNDGAEFCGDTWREQIDAATRDYDNNGEEHGP